MLAGAMATYPWYYRRKYAAHKDLSITVFNGLTSSFTQTIPKHNCFIENYNIFHSHVSFKYEIT